MAQPFLHSNLSGAYGKWPNAEEGSSLQNANIRNANVELRN